MKALNQRRDKQKSKMLYKRLESFDAIIFVATTFTSGTLSVTDIGFGSSNIIESICTRNDRSFLSIFELIMQKHMEPRNYYEPAQRTINSFDNYYGKSLQDKIIDKKESESLSNISTNYLSENKNQPLFSENSKSHT